MQKYGKMPPVRQWTLERTLEESDTNGIDAAMLSLSPPAFRPWMIPPITRRSSTRGTRRGLFGNSGASRAY